MSLGIQRVQRTSEVVLVVDEVSVQMHHFRLKRYTFKEAFL
jgi:hypothetical protein